MTEAVIIPARYHSSRLPGKCLADVAGRPALAWAVDIARDGDTSRRVIVFSECSETLQLARRLGCETVVEPLSMARRNIYEIDMARFVCDSLLDAPEIVAVIYGNSVIAPAGIVGRLIDAVRLGADYAQSVAPVPVTGHPWKMVDSSLGEFIPGAADRWTQDYAQSYVITSAGMAFRRDVLKRLDGKSLLQADITRTSVVHEPMPVGDIDTADELLQARKLIKGNINACCS